MWCSLSSIAASLHHLKCVALSPSKGEARREGGQWRALPTAAVRKPRWIRLPAWKGVVRR